MHIKVMRYGSVVGGLLVKGLFRKNDIIKLIKSNTNEYAEKSGRLMG